MNHLFLVLWVKLTELRTYFSHPEHFDGKLDHAPKVSTNILIAKDAEERTLYKLQYIKQILNLLPYLRCEEVQLSKIKDQRSLKD